MKTNNHTPISIQKLDKSPLLHLNKTKNSKKTILFSYFQLILIISLTIIIIAAVVYAHLNLKKQMMKLEKETNDSMTLLEQQKIEINELKKTIKEIEEEIEEIEEKKKKYVSLLSESIASTEHLQQEFNKLNETLNSMNSIISYYEAEIIVLKSKIEMKRKS